jgi:predicted ATPase/DNA-binding winged helix-turn-helix (wHTH) protein
MTGDSAERPPRSFAFGPFVLFPERQLLVQDETPVRIGGRALEILTALVERPGELLSKRELMARVWPNIIVDEGNLKVNMAALRRALGDGQGTAKYIATVTGRGYRFTGAVQINGFSAASTSWTAAPRSHNLPTATSRIFGRADTIDAIRRDLDESRVVSLVGAGGIGKTTVALAVAERALAAFKDGVWLIDLAPLKDPVLTPNAIAKAIGLAVHSADVLAILCESLRDREMLLLLDSCEHIIDAAASCADRILAQGAGVRILATSREPLRVKGERVRRLPGLGAPPPSSHLSAMEALSFPAIELFVDRATDSFELFELNDADAPAAAEICRRLDGLALAIELAATRIDTFGVAGLLKQLDDRFRLLVGRRAGPERHRTLIETLDWSFGLLTESETALMCAISVFAGPFDIEGASVVSNVAPAEAAHALAQLAAKSLLAIDVDTDGVAYRLLETTRAFCLERLRVSGEDQAIRRRHAEHVRTELERATAEWAGRPAHEWATDYGRFLDDLRGALAWAAQDSTQRHLRIRLTVAGLLLWNHFSLTEECGVHVSRAVQDLEAANLAGTAYEMHLKVWLGASTMFTHGLQPLAMDAMQQALEVAIQIGDTDCHLRCLRTIGLYQHLTGNHAAGLRTFETFASLVAATDSPTAPEGEFHVSISEFFIGRLPSARSRLRRLREHTQDAGRQTVRYQSDINIDMGCVLTVVEWLTGSPDAAARTARATVERALQARHHMSLSNALIAACPVFYWSGHFDECGRGIAMLDEEGRRHRILTRRPVAMFYRAALTCARKGHAEGIEGLERAIAEFRAINHLARMPYYLGVLADAQARCGRPDEGKTTIQAALDLAHTNSEGWCLPEVQRVHASILIANGDEREAEALLLDSMTLARRTGALSWRLRAATDLARLWSAASRAEDACKLLSPVYAEFNEGLETPDLVIAGELIATLESRPGRMARPS